MIFLVRESREGDTVTIEAVKAADSDNMKKLLNTDDPHGSCALCRLNVDVKYSVRYSTLTTVHFLMEYLFVGRSYIETVYER